MTGRTFKCFTRSIELRAYIPNQKIWQLRGQSDNVACEIKTALPDAPGHDTLKDELQVASNRAGLHLAYDYIPADNSTHYHCVRDDGANCGYAKAILALEAAGWKQCKGD